MSLVESRPGFFHRTASSICEAAVGLPLDLFTELRELHRLYHSGSRESSKTKERFDVWFQKLEDYLGVERQNSES